jgi:hypothetical protein
MIRTALIAALTASSFLPTTRVEAQPQRPFDRPQREQVRPDGPMEIVRDGDRRRGCRDIDLEIFDQFVLTNQAINVERGEVTFDFYMETDNIGECHAGRSRTKAILTLAGGRWLGQGWADLAPIAPGSNRGSTISITLPYAGLLDENCTLSRDDWVVTAHADFQTDVRESDESNNTREFSFSSSTSSVCS